MVHVVPVDVAEEGVIHDFLGVSRSTAKTVVRLAGQELLKDRHRVPWHRNRIQGLICENGIVDLVFVFTSEWRLLQKHLVDQDAKRPPIYRAAVLLVEQNLGMGISIRLQCTVMVQLTSGAMNSGVPQNVLVVDPYHISSLQRP